MEKTAIYHRPESEYAYLYDKDLLHIRLRTKKNDVKKVSLICGDPYLIQEEEWFKQSLEMTKLASTELFDYWMVVVTAKHRRIQYGFHVVGFDKEELFYGDRAIEAYDLSVISKAENYFRMPYFQEADRVKTPEWVKETVWYQIFPERFANGDSGNDPVGTLAWGSKEHPGREDFFGGDLQGVVDHLDYLEDLGINGIYFCPIFKASSNHKYDTIDYYEIDPDFGDKELFKLLIQEAHKRGIRVMLDAVFNHMGYFSNQWLDVVENEEKSKYVDWFHIQEFPVAFETNGNHEGSTSIAYDTFAFTPKMPKLNTENPEVQDYLLGIATYWIKEFDIDAWRLDVANEVDHQFWKKFYHATTQIKEDFYILGEIWHSSQNWLNGDEFHAVMNYAYTETILNYFVKNTVSGEEMKNILFEQLMLYRQQTNEVMFNMLDSHDTARLLTMAKENKNIAKMTLAFTFLQHGSPCVYYGTEIGMTGENDPDCRKCMVWEEDKQDKEFLQFMKNLIALRRDNQTIFSYGNIEINIFEKENVIKITRQGDDKKIVAYFNIGENEYVVNNYPSRQLLTQNSNRTNEEIIIGKEGFIILEE